MIEVDDTTIYSAANIHAEAWRDSHAAFCPEEFVALHTTERQMKYLQDEMDKGKRLYMLVADKPVGIVSVKDDLIENLYVLPSEQRKGYGTRLLDFALSQCSAAPRLWILDNNHGAYALYYKFGFRLTGEKHQLSPTLAELEMKLADRG